MLSSSFFFLLNEHNAQSGDNTYFLKFIPSAILSVNYFDVLLCSFANPEKDVDKVTPMNIINTIKFFFSKQILEMDDDGSEDDSGLLDWANTVDYEDDDSSRLETEEDLRTFLLGNQKSKKEHDKRGMSLFNRFLLLKGLPNFESDRFSRQMLTSGLLISFVKWICNEEHGFSLYTVDKYVSAVKLRITGTYEDTLNSIFLHDEFYKKLRKSFSRAVVERCKQKGVKVKNGAPCFTLEQLRYFLEYLFNNGLVEERCITVLGYHACGRICENIELQCIDVDHVILETTTVRCFLT